VSISNCTRVIRANTDLSKPYVNFLKQDIRTSGHTGAQHEIYHAWFHCP